MNLVVLIKKNILVLLRAKSSAAIIVLGPLLVILLAGLAFDNTNTYAVKVGTFSSQYNSLSTSFVDRLSQSQFSVKKYASQDTCVQAIKSGDIHTCVVFSPDFTLAKNLSNEIQFFVDYSRLNLVWTVLDVMSKSVRSRSQELSTNLTAVLLRALEATATELKARGQHMISLTTLNEESHRLATLVQTDLGSLDVDSRLDQDTLNNMSHSKGLVNYWFGALSVLADKSLDQADKGIRAAQDLLGKDLNTSTLKKERTSIDLLRLDLANASGMAKNQVNDFNLVSDALTLQIEQTKSQLARLTDSKTVNKDRIDTLVQNLDHALIQVVFVQKSMNHVQEIIDAIEVIDPASIVAPIQTSIKPVVAERSYLNYVFPVLIVLVIMFTALLVSQILVLMDKNSPAGFRNYLSPAPPLMFAGAIFLTSVLLVVFQSIIILTIAGLFFTAQVLGSLGATSIVLLTVILLFSLAGMLIGELFNTEETATLAAVMIGSALLFVSDVIIPIESMPSWLQTVSGQNPFVLGSTVLRKTMLFHESLGEVSLQLSALLGYCVLLGLALTIAIQLRKRK